MTEGAAVISEQSRRDSAGETLHAGLALLFMASLPIGTAPSNILSGPLVLITLWRWRAIAPALRALLCWPPVLFALGFLAWSALTLLWSADPARGGYLLVSMRALIVPVCLVPVLRHRRALAMALLAGIVVQALMQTGQFAVNRAAWNFDGLARFGGFTHDPGKAGLWDAIGVCGAVALALVASRRASVVGLILTLICGAGVVASGTRRQLLALAVALPVLMAWVLVMIPARRARVLILVLVIGVSTVLAWPIVGPTVLTRWRQTMSQIYGAEATTEGADDSLANTAPPIPGVVHYDLRAYYWNSAIEAWRAQEWHGLGLGGSGRAIASSPDRARMEHWLRRELAREYPQRTTAENESDLRSRLESDHPHSTWVQLMVETGLIGLMLAFGCWGTALMSVVRRSIADREHDPISLACAAAMLLWAIGAIFDASINASTLSAVAVIALLGGVPQSATSGFVPSTSSR